MVPATTCCSRGAAFLLALLLTSALPCQRTWIVDASNGTGANFTDLPPAFAAASAGDTILVRAGAYSTASVNKPLRVLGAPGALLGTGNPCLTISGIPAGATFVLSDVQEGRDSGHIWVTRFDLEGPTAWTLRGGEVGWTSFLGYSSLPDAGETLGFDEFFELGAGFELPRLGRVPPLELSAAWVAGPDLRGWSLGVSLAD
jgi:hypothetical protein